MTSPNEMTLQQQIILRYRDEGHVRFELPEALCTSEQAQHLKARLRRIEGVYRVDLYPGQHKLSIRYVVTVLGFIELARELYDVVDGLDKPDESSGLSNQTIFMSPLGPWRERLKNTRLIRWFRDKYQEARETVTALGIVARQKLQKPPDLFQMDAVVGDFLNDVLVFYLIKVHWHLFTQHWLRNPLRYRNELLAVFYLIFLLVQSRQAKLLAR